MLVRVDGRDDAVASGDDEDDDEARVAHEAWIHG